MSDTELTAAERNESEDEKRNRSYETIGTILLIVTVIVVVLLLWRSCDTSDQAGGATDSGAVIQELEDLQQVDTAVSVWLKEGIDIQTVLNRNGLEGAPATDMGEGTWVIEIGEADSAAAVKQLKADPGLNDAGFLYHDATKD